MFQNEPPFNNWLDKQDVMQILHISSRTLYTLRTNGTLPFSRIGNKLYYKHSDIQQLLKDNYTLPSLSPFSTLPSPRHCGLDPATSNLLPLEP